LGVDNQFSTVKLAAQSDVMALQLLDLSCPERVNDFETPGVISLASKRI
jgi:hypothetical protein